MTVQRLARPIPTLAMFGVSVNEPERFQRCLERRLGELAG